MSNPPDAITLRMIQAALEEDIGAGDITAEFFTPREALVVADALAKEAGVASGAAVAAGVFQALDAGVKIDYVAPEGTALEVGDVVYTVSGEARSVLTAERVSLNFLGKLCGVATMARRYVDLVEGTRARILDTRKTTPGFRLLEKAATKAGGATNHRMGLYDQVMVKDNHLLAEGNRDALAAGVSAARAKYPDLRIELEADTLEQAGAFFAMPGVDVVLLDNMSNAQLREAVAMNAGRVELEASGGVNLETVRGIAETGVDWISVGALTHSAPCLDISLTFRG